MQETYISAFKNLLKFEHRSLFKTWIARIMLNLCYKKRHKLSFQNEVPMEDMGMEKSKKLFENYRYEKITPLYTELGRVIENAIHEIPERYRMVFTLRELNGMSVSETAESLNITEGNVKVRLSRARAMLQSKIARIYSIEDIFDFNRGNFGF
jgi:RNA polymerase sigma-70 factor (ECF subfamily)